KTTPQPTPEPMSVPVVPALDDPLAPAAAEQAGAAAGTYETLLAEGEALRRRPYTASGEGQILRQHAKDRMTVWERIDVLKAGGTEPVVLWQNGGKNPDGAPLVTTIVKIRGRDVALYGHASTVRAGSMDATNGRKLADHIYLAGDRGMP